MGVDVTRSAASVDVTRSRSSDAMRSGSSDAMRSGSSDAMRSGSSDMKPYGHAQLSGGFDHRLGFASSAELDRATMRKDSERSARHENSRWRDDVTAPQPVPRSRSSSSESRGSSLPQQRGSRPAAKSRDMSRRDSASPSNDDARSRSRSPQVRVNGDDGGGGEDEVLKLFKKKFYGRTMQSSISTAPDRQ